MERRDFIYRVGLAGASLPFLDATAASAQTAQAKSVIYIFLSGGLSQYDSFNVEVDTPVLGKSTILKSMPTGFVSAITIQSWPSRWTRFLS